MMELLNLPADDSKQLQQAWNEMRESFMFKMMQTFKELLGFPSATALSKKLVKVSVVVIHGKKEAPVPEETLNLPHGAVTLSRVDCQSRAIIRHINN